VLLKIAVQEQKAVNNIDDDSAVLLLSRMWREWECHRENTDPSPINISDPIPMGVADPNDSHSL